MRILVIEHSHIGHRFPYLRMLLSALCELSDQITLAIPKDSVDTDEYRSQIAQFEELVEIDAWLPSHRRMHTWKKPAEIRKAIRRARANYLYVPHADGYAQVIGLSRLVCFPTIPHNVEAEVLVMRGTFAYPQSGIKSSIKGVISKLLTMNGPWDKLHFLDPIVYKQLQSSAEKKTKSISLLPDPVPPALNLSKQEARLQLGLPVEGRYIVSAGALDERKGTDLLIRAFKQANRKSNDRLLLAGRLTPAMRAIIDAECGELISSNHIISMDRFISDDEFNLAITAGDVICTPYRNHIGSASIAIRAAAAHRYVLASSYGWLGYVVPKFKLGHVTDTQSVDTLAHELIEALKEAPCHTWGIAAGNFAAFHSEENFVAIWTSRLRERLGKPDDSQKITWDMVMASAND